MKQRIVLTKAGQLEWQILPGDAKYKVIAKGDKFRTGIGVVHPGGGETWHKHTTEVEETYFLLEGKGKIWWKSNGKEYDLEFSQGDGLYLPYGIENQFVNTGNKELLLLYSITNASKMRE